MAKATNKGTCQACGAAQKLPGGVLSTHGYTVRMGWFSGICMGTGYAPYETSCSLIEKTIAAAEAKIANLEAHVAEVKGRTGVTATVAARRTVNGKMLREITTVELIDGNYGQPAFMFEGKMQQTGYYGSKENVAAQLNMVEVNRVNAIIEQVKSYAAAQRERIANWTELPLLPL